VQVPVIASGGASCAKHMLDAVRLGDADAVLAASIFHDREITVDRLKQEIVGLDEQEIAASDSGSAGSAALKFRAVDTEGKLSLPESTSGLGQKATDAKNKCRQHCVPSIDILDGKVVQLVGGDPDAPGKIVCGDPLDMIEQLSLVGEVAVIDLNAALSRPLPGGQAESGEVFR